ncbi:DoxX family membrane protein [Streptomyces mashuensis]|nr:DoxX family membrane protein [Streptomyces mashuensis]
MAAFANVVRAMARPLLAAPFVTSGVQTVARPETVAPTAAPVALAIAEWVPVLPRDAAALVRLNGALHLGAGTLLGAGVLPRASALALAASLVPTTLAGHAFWKETDPARRAQHRVAFYGNLAVLGGLLVTATAPRRHGCCPWRLRRLRRG